MLRVVLLLCLLPSPAPPPPAVPAPKSAPEEKTTLRLTAKSVVILDGREVKFADVPDDAACIAVDAKSDGTINRIEFKSKVKP